VNDYTKAPATKMLATNCAVCSRPLLDALSVEIGIGPICRKRHGYNEEVAALSDQDRQAANLIINHVASNPRDWALREASCASLRLLGFKKLADRVLHRGHDAPEASGPHLSDTVEVVPHVLPAQPPSRRWPNGLYAKAGWLVRAPFRDDAIAAWRAVPGRIWVGDAKANFVPEAQRVALWELLRRHYAGLRCVGPMGDKIIPGIIPGL